MGNTRDTGYLRNLVTYDGSGNITLPANLTVTGTITGYATTSYVTTQINNLINGAPGLLDTLDELAAALGDDANFAATLTTSLAGKQSTLTFTGPLVNTSGTVAITQSSGSTNGFLSNTDWTTFNSKQSTLTFSGPLVNTSGTISITQSSGSTNGYLSNTDWSTFNNKQAALSGTGFVKISGTTISYDNSTYLTTASATSTYLPLAGGTLTGPLLGTSGKFSTGLAVTGNSNLNAASMFLADFYSGNTRFYSLGADASTKGGYEFHTNSSNGSLDVIALGIANTGTATFSSTVQSIGQIVYSPTLGYVSTSYQSYAGATTWYVGAGSSGVSIQPFVIGRNLNGNSADFSIASTGAATFSSSVSVGSGSWLTFNNVNTIFSQASVGFFLQQPDGSTVTTFRSSTGATQLTIGTGTGAATFGSTGTFGGRVQSSGGGSSTNDGGFKINYYNNASSRSYLLLNDVTVYGDFGVYQSTTQTGTIYSPLLYFTLAGAATFSSSVTAEDGFISNSDSYTPNGFYKLRPNPSITAARWWRITSDNVVYGDFSIAQSSANSDASYTNILYFNAAGAATFSSRVNINGATDNALYALNIYGDATFDGTRATPAYVYARRNGDDSKLILKAGSTATYFSQIDVSGWNGTGTPAYISLNSGSGTGIYVKLGNNIGVGTVTPSAKLDVYAGADATSNLVLWGQIIRNEGNGAATGYGAGLKLKISSDGEPYKWAGIAALAGTGYSNRTDLGLFTAATSTADATEKVRITGDGSFGIGTIAPARTFHVMGQAAFDMTSTGVVIQSNGTVSEIVSYKQTGSTYADLHLRGSNLGIVINGTSGNVGINTTSPSGRLHVYQSAASDTYLETGTGGTSGKLIFKTSDNGDLNKYIGMEAYYMMFSGHANEGFKWRDSNSNVLMALFGSNNAYGSKLGINTITPGYSLDVNGTIRTDGTSNGVYFRNGYSALIRNPNNNTRDLQIEGDGVTVFFKAAGNVLINYSTVWNSEKFGIQIANSNNWANVPAIMRLTNYGSGYIPKITFTDSSIIDGWFGMVPVSGNSYFVMGFSGYTEQGFKLYQNGNLTIAGTITESSSIRYKTNVETIKYGLDKILQLRGVTYDKKDTGVREIGLIAEEVNEILPDVVIKNKEGEPDSVSYGRITAILIEAIKELKLEVEKLKNK